MSSTGTQTKYTYWVRRDDTPQTSGMAIAGWTTQADEIPSYGEIGKLPLPTELIEITEPDGGILLYTPPVICGKWAYRFWVKPGAVRADATLNDIRFLHFSIERVEAPMEGSDRENWWFYIQRMKGFEYASKAPVRLMKKWTGPLLERICPQLEQGDALLEEWAILLAGHKDSARRRGAPQKEARKTYGARKDGVLVIADRPSKFSDDVHRQLFRLQKVSGKRNLVATTGGGSQINGRLPVQPLGVQRLKDIKAPAQVAYTTLSVAMGDALGETPAAHHRIGVHGRFTPLIAEFREETMRFLDETKAQIEAGSAENFQQLALLGDTLREWHRELERLNDPLLAEISELHRAARAQPALRKLMDE